MRGTACFSGGPLHGERRFMEISSVYRVAEYPEVLPIFKPDKDRADVMIKHHTYKLRCVPPGHFYAYEYQGIS